MELTKLTKAKLRSKILSRLKLQKEEDRRRKSRLIKDKLFRTLIFRKAKRIMFFVSFDSEVDTQEMIREAQNKGKIVTVPVCGRKRSIRPSLFSRQAQFKIGPYGAREPAMKKFVDFKRLDLVVVPGLAFDNKGNRLGRGKGYYDRFLERLQPHTGSIGLAFDFQILPAVPTAANDSRVKKVISA